MVLSEINVETGSQPSPYNYVHIIVFDILESNILKESIAVVKCGANKSSDNSLSKTNIHYTGECGEDDGCDKKNTSDTFEKYAVEN